MPYLTKDQVSELEKVEKGVRNRWRWDWIEEKDSEGKKFRSWVEKMDAPGVAFCTVCLKSIKYGSSGKKKLREHADHAEHQKNTKITGSVEKLHVVEDSTASPGNETDTRQPTIGLSSADNIAEIKARILAFAAEKNLPFVAVPDLLELCKTLSADKKALLKTSFSRQSATYGLTCGLAEAFRHDLRQKLKDRFFSLNLDEATNNANDKIVNILVRFFDEDQGEVVTEHLGSKAVNQATASNIYEAVMDVLRGEEVVDAEGSTRYPDAIPVKNLISCLMDNCATMRGVKGGVEPLLRKANANLLDIAGDTVHTVSNAAKLVFTYFDGHVCNIATDIFYDLDTSPKGSDLFREVQCLLSGDANHKYLNVIRPISSRFLQMLQVTDRLAALMDALRVYYYSFLSEDEQKRHRSDLEGILEKKNVSEDCATRIAMIQRSQGKQAKSSCNLARKDRLLSALFHNYKMFSTMVNIYRGILEKFQGFVKYFQAEKPTLHKLHSEMFLVSRQALTLFVKGSVIPDDSIKKLMKLKKDLREDSFQVSDRQLCVGQYAFNEYSGALEDKSQAHWAWDVAKKLRKGLQDAAEFLLEKLPLRNKTIMHLSALDPAAHKDPCTLTSLMDLAKLLPAVVPLEERGKLDLEIRDYIADGEVVKLRNLYHRTPADSKRIDVFWHNLSMLCEGEKYLTLTRLAKAVLSIFTGPLVESSFNTMDDCVRTDRTNLLVENYEAVALVRSSLKSRKVTATTLKVDANMRHLIRISKARYTKTVERRKKKKIADQRKKIQLAVASLKKNSTSTCRTIRCGARASQSPEPATSLSAKPTTSRSTEPAGNQMARPTASQSAELSTSQSTKPTSQSTEATASTSADPPLNLSTDPAVSQPAHNPPHSSTLPKGGKRAALRASSDIRQFFKTPRLEADD